MNNNIKVLITRDFPIVGTGLLLKEGFSVTQRSEDKPMSQAELIEKAKKHQAIYCTMTEKLDKHFFAECPNIEIVSQFAVGYDNIDIAEATRLKIPVGYTPDVLSEATADVAFGLMITTSRKMLHLHKTILRGEWGYFMPNSNLGIDIKNKTLGIFGLGRIGFEMAKRCKGAYNMDIIYHNRNKNRIAEEQLGARKVSFEELLTQSDVLSVHCALSNETKNIFNKDAFDKMKNTSIFINTSRGLVHNEIDLLDALNSGQIWGAGLDVSNPEPMNPNNPLLNMPNVTVLPHIGSGTVEVRNKMAIMTAENIIEFYKNKTVPNIVNPEVLKK